MEEKKIFLSVFTKSQYWTKFLLILFFFKLRIVRNDEGQTNNIVEGK